MKIEQFVMAYQVEQDRLRAFAACGLFLPSPCAPAERGNSQDRGGQETFYLEYNTPVAAFGKRGWLNIAHWASPETAVTCARSGKSVTFQTPFLQITYTGVGLQGAARRAGQRRVFLLRAPSPSALPRPLTKRRSFVTAPSSGALLRQTPRGSAWGKIDPGPAHAAGENLRQAAPFRPGRGGHPV